MFGILSHYSKINNTIKVAALKGMPVALYVITTYIDSTQFR
jgi:hypothetical protein